MIYLFFSRNIPLEFLTPRGFQLICANFKRVVVTTYIQECLTNIFRHAEAQECSVTLAMVETPEHQFRLTVTDNGKGCDINKLTKGYGILGMKERVHSLGGNLSIQSTLNKGVQVIAVIPIIVN
jgi:two-component system sensor histidine kinase UhpB